MKIKDLKFLKVNIEKHPTKDFQLEYLEHHNAVAVLILDEKEEETLLVKQYRPGKKGMMYEVPAGLIDEGEDKVEAMYREVEEETGYSKSDFEELYLAEKPLLISPGYTTESLSFYILRLKDNNTVPKEQQLDEGEDLTTHWIKLDKINQLETDLKTHYLVDLYKLIKK